MEMAIDWKVMHGLGFRRYLDMIRDLDLDAVSVNQLLYKMGIRRIALKFLKHYTDEWGVRSRLTGEILPIPVNHPTPSLQEAEQLAIPDPRRNPLLRAIRYAKRHVPDRAIVMLSRADFAASWFLCGMEELLVSYVEAPEFAHKLGQMVSEYYCELFGLAAKAGADVIILTDDYAYGTGTLMSPGQFREFVLPYFQKAVNAVKSSGALCVKHTDGNINEILEDIVATGVDGIGPLEPGAGMELSEVRKRVGSKVCLIGNVDVDLLSRGTADQVGAEARRLIAFVGRSGGHILSSGNTITQSVQPDNFLAMVRQATGPSW